MYYFKVYYFKVPVFWDCKDMNNFLFYKNFFQTFCNPCRIDSTFGILF